MHRANIFLKLMAAIYVSSGLWVNNLCCSWIITLPPQKGKEAFKSNHHFLITLLVFPWLRWPSSGENRVFAKIKCLFSPPWIDDIKTANEGGKYGFKFLSTSSSHVFYYFIRFSLSLFHPDVYQFRDVLAGVSFPEENLWKCRTSWM